MSPDLRSNGTTAWLVSPDMRPVPAGTSGSPGATLQRAGNPSKLDDAWRWLRARTRKASPASLPQAVKGGLSASSWPMVTADALPATLAAELPRLRQRLRAEGWQGLAGGELLALLACVSRHRLGITPYPTQLLATWSLLDGQLIEMATGEGKTLATGLAAAGAALAGIAVQVLTANDYLVQRDRESLLPVFDALGLRSACVLPSDDRHARRQAYACDVVYLCARELVFDHLRDHQRLPGERDATRLRAEALASGSDETAVLPPLRLALVDEADSILLDEATVPLILSAPGEAIDLTALRRAQGLAGVLAETTDYRLDAASLRASLTTAGRLRVERAVQGGQGWLRPVRRAVKLVEQALVARHLLQSGRHYVLRGGRLQMIDELTGRIAEGRQWSEALHGLVELKEGLQPGPALHTAAQITYQSFFPRYERLAGLSGTLRENRVELALAYDLDIRRVPLARPDRRLWLGQRVFRDIAGRDAALVASVQRMREAGRPVLIGTDSVSASQHVAAALAAAGIDAQVLNALQDADEAQAIARAGQAGRVTVATNIAGRGTDIRLDEQARAAGGLHVIAMVLNRSARIDRQLIGRAARHGDPGSAERLLCLDDRVLQQWLPGVALRPLRASTHDHPAVPGKEPGAPLPSWLGRALTTCAQHRAQSHDTGVRRLLRRAGHRAREFYGFAGGTE